MRNTRVYVFITHEILLLDEKYGTFGIYGIWNTKFGTCCVCFEILTLIVFFLNIEYTEVGKLQTCQKFGSVRIKFSIATHGRSLPKLYKYKYRNVHIFISLFL